MHINGLHSHQNGCRRHPAVMGACPALRGDAAAHVECLRQRTGGWIERHVLLAFDSGAARILGSAGKHPRGREEVTPKGWSQLSFHPSQKHPAGTELTGRQHCQGNLPFTKHPLASPSTISRPTRSNQCKLPLAKHSRGRKESISRPTKYKRSNLPSI